ncbi:hypothetical protein GCM10009839_42800 [Catenulispora yoronensis]|uniref:Uncharacterized protein n=1 Tax=Catenulispora yoronensis TaxID=450799 RepID=A0ABN2UGD7_9ACTN
MISRSEFQLVLLRRMADYQPALVERARLGLGFSITEMREANAWWQRYVRSRSAPRGAERFRAALGPPEAVLDQRTGDLVCKLHHWVLPLWPELRFEIVVGPGGQVWQEWLVREPGTAPPTPHSGQDSQDSQDNQALEPWKYVVGDLERMYTRVRHLPEDAPTRWASEYGYEDKHGAVVRRRAQFVYGLLQEVSEPLT